MTPDAESNVEFAVFGDAADREASSRQKSAPMHMGSHDRISLYIAVAGLLDGGYGMAEAADLLANEYRACERRMAAATVETFFGGIARGGMGLEVAELAERAFGKRFVGVEEMALLRALPASVSPASILRSAADLVAHVAAASSGPVPRVGYRG